MAMATIYPQGFTSSMSNNIPMTSSMNIPIEEEEERAVVLRKRVLKRILFV